MVWEFASGTAVASAQTPTVTHVVLFNPRSKREFVTLGVQSVVFWLLTESWELLMEEVEFPDIFDNQHFTAGAFRQDSTLWVGTNCGVIGLVDAQTNAFLASFRAHRGEIGLCWTWSPRVSPRPSHHPIAHKAVEGLPHDIRVLPLILCRLYAMVWSHLDYWG